MCASRRYGALCEVCFCSRTSISRHLKALSLFVRVDYVGIGWYVYVSSLRLAVLLKLELRLISASVGTVVYYGFSCNSEAVMAYLSLCLVTGIAGSIFPFMRWFNDRKYKVCPFFLFNSRSALTYIIRTSIALARRLLPRHGLYRNRTVCTPRVC